MKKNFKVRSMQSLARFILSYYKLITLVSVVFAIVGIILVFSLGIELKTNIKDMLPKDPKSIEFSNILDNFHGASSLYIVVQGKEEDTVPFSRNLVKKIKEQERFKSFIQYIKLEEDKDFINKHALLISKNNQVNNSLELYKDLRLIPFLKAYNDNMERVYFGEYKQEEIATNKQEFGVDASMANIERFMDLLIDYFRNSSLVPIGTRATKLANLMTTGESIQISQDRELLLITVQPKFTWDNAEYVVDEINSFDEFISKEASKQDGVKLLLGGMWAMQRDELKHMNEDMQYTPIIALFLIIGLFVLSFRAARSIVFIVLALIIAFCWELGLITITFGQLTMMSSSFGVVLIGLGVDFGIHLASQYTQSRGEGLNKQEALEGTFLKTGYGIILGAITTSIAFYTLALTDSYMMQEFGIITGSGILICVLSMLTFLPSILIWLDKKSFKETPPKLYLNYGFLEKLGTLSTKYPMYIIIISLVITVILGYFALKNEFEYDLLKLEPQEAQSIVASRLILEKFDMSTDYVMVSLKDDDDKSVSTLLYKDKLSAVEKGHRIQKIVETHNNVAMVDTISQYLPSKEQQDINLKLLKKLRAVRAKSKRTSRNKVYNANLVDSLIHEIKRLESNIIELGDMTMTSFGEDSKVVKRRDKMIRKIRGASHGESSKEVFRTLIDELKRDKAKSVSSLGVLSKRFRQSMSKKVDILSSPTEPVTLDSLPETIKTRYISKDGKYKLVTILIKDNVWDEVVIRKLSNYFEKVKIRHLPYSYFHDDLLKGDLSKAKAKLSSSNGTKNRILPLDKAANTSDITNDDAVAILGSAQEKDEDFSIDLAQIEREQAVLLPKITTAEKELKKDPNEYISFTGTPSLMIESTNSIVREGKRAMIIALIAIFVLTLIYAASIKYAVIMILPVVFGFIWMVGFMYLSGIKFDYFNYFALPIILGIGIDDGIHIIHRFRVEGDDKPNIVLKYTGRSILLTSLTNVFAFGTMSIFSSYVGLAGFGTVLSYGVITCFLISILLVPSLVYILRKKRFKRI